ncbi:hypothetical protein L1277_000053 [Okibacterium sp. HSC-33S16]|uniref:FHA domain-containing protein n=1 Tax=Okibacterium sp. HSC-33S16 TaxID=2910965 RepID=UPI0020A11C64|nr:FHA domain-containing protein [Okibacterium sp. HSC-33S16]MCP2029989.1 hypothetical protein [Okibacterium sp. HSC-33S16]
MTGYLYADAPEHDWLAVATTGRVLVARVGGDSERIAQVAAAGEPAASVQNVLEMLTARGLSNVGPFALVFWVDGAMASNGLGVIVRGGATVTVVTDDDTVVISSRGVTTWTEQVIENALTFTVDTGTSSATAELLPLGQGAAWVSSIRLDADAPQAVTTDAVGTAVAPEPVATRPDVEPEASTPAASAATPAASTGSASTESALAESTEETRVFHTTTGGKREPEAAAAEPDVDGYDYLFGATVFRTVGSAAVEQAGDAEDESGAPSAPAAQGPTAALPVTPQQPSQPAVAPTSTLGDHDGHTMLAADIIEARRRAKERAGRHAPQQQAAPTPPESPSILPPSHAYVLELPDGGRQALSAPVILGRAPSVSNVPASVLPHLVTLVGDDISRSHLRVAVEGGTVVVTDLHSSNGTHVIAPGKPPQLLRGGEPTPVIVGTTIDLGSDVLLRITEA